MKTYADHQTMNSSVLIYETIDGWRINWGNGSAETHSTAADALAAVQKRDRAMVDTGISCITVIEWWPTTSIGFSVVRALQ